MLPTPGAALLVRRYGFDLAAVVSASHNPYEDNGIKFFGPEGTKLADAQEDADRAARARAPAERRRSAGCASCTAPPATTCASSSRASRSSTCPGRRILLDCANGATYRVAPEIFRRLGADLELVAVDPDGRNINRDCGLDARGRPGRARWPRAASTIGFAFDGDGDRVLAVDRDGRGGGRRRADGAGRAPPARAAAGCPATAWP